MPNLDLQGAKFKLVDNLTKGYFNGADSVSYAQMANLKSELTNKAEKNGTDAKVLLWVTNQLAKASDMVDKPKKLVKDLEGQGNKKGGNAYKDTHEKDRDNANPTGVNLPKLKGSASDQVYKNQIRYESELDKIKYLMEYLSRNA